jgi:hypothetical protein
MSQSRVFSLSVADDDEYLNLGNAKQVARGEAKKKICIVSSIRNEGIYILEWVAHYRVLGVDSIVIYTNDNTDNSDELLRILAEHGLIYLRWNETAPNKSPQMKAFRYAFFADEVVSSHEWAMFLDLDEFLVPTMGKMIYPFLSEIESNYAASAIAVNWKWFAGSRSYDWQNEMSLVRFRDSRTDAHVKTLFKLRDAADLRSLHHPIMLPGTRSVDGCGRELGALAPRSGPCYGLAQINHYWQRSFQEFFLKKSRGRGALGLGGAQRDYSDFFRWWAPGESDPLPLEDHVGRVKMEMANIRALKGVDAAVERVEASVADVLARHADIRAIYESLVP